MRGLGIVVNIFVPGVGTLIVGKIGEGIAQIILYWFGVILCFTLVGAIIGVPICIAVWIWGLVSAANSPSTPPQVIIQNVVSGSGTASGSIPAGAATYTQPQLSQSDRQQLPRN